RVAKADVVAAARARSDAFNSAVIAAYAGDAADAQAQLQGQPPSPARDVYLALVIGLGGDSATSLAQLEAILPGHPADWVAASFAARVAHRAGDDAATARFSAWAISVQGDTAPAFIAEGSVAPGPTTDASASLPGTYPWAVYLRPVTPFLAVPELTT